MRATFVVAAALPLFLAGTSPGRATAIVQDIAGLSQSLGDLTPFDIDAVPFDPANGVLQSVSLELLGSYTPQTANDLGPFPTTTTLTTRLFVFATNGGPVSNVALGSQSGVPVLVAAPGAAGIATGATEPVDRTFGFSDLATFESGTPGSQLLVEYGFRTSNTLSGAGGASDLTSFSGSAVLTYTYDVPEPAGAAVLATALLALGWLRRRRRPPAARSW